MSCSEENKVRFPRKTTNFLRYKRQYRRNRPAVKAAPKGPAKPLEPVGGRYSKQVLRDCFLTVQPFTGGFEHTLAQRSACFRFRPSESKYQPHQGAQEMARRAGRGW